jgi:hypothetical protein
LFGATPVPKLPFGVGVTAVGVFPPNTELYRFVKNPGLAVASVLFLLPRPVPVVCEFLEEELFVVLRLVGFVVPKSELKNLVTLPVNEVEFVDPAVVVSVLLLPEKR